MNSELSIAREFIIAQGRDLEALGGLVHRLPVTAVVALIGAGSLDSLPHNANGKLDRKALPAIDIGSQHSQAYLAPRNELEAVLAGIWADVLKAERVGVHDNFFELGGHSLLATQIASRVQKQLQLNVPLRAMFECSTVEELAEYIDGLAASDITEEKVDRLNDLMAELEGL